MTGVDSRSAARRFAAGFTRPSWTALTLSLIVAAVLVGSFAQILHSRAFLRLPLPWVLSDSRAYYVENSWRAYQLARRWRDDVFYIIVVGGSSLRRGFADQDTLARELSRESGRRIEIVNLAAGGQTYADAMVLLDQLDNDIDALVLSGMSISRFNKPLRFAGDALSGKRGLLHSDYVARLVETDGFDVPSGFAGLRQRFSGYLGDYLSNRWELLVYPERFCALHTGGDYVDRCHAYYRDSWLRRLQLWWMLDIEAGSLFRFTPAAYRYAVSALDAQAIPMYERWHKENVRFVTRFAAFCRERNLDLVFVQQPESEGLVNGYANAYDDYRGLSREVAATNEVPLWLDVARAGYDDERHFVDLSHLSPAGKPLFQAALHERLRSALRARLDRAGTRQAADPTEMPPPDLVLSQTAALAPFARTVSSTRGVP